MRSIISPSHLTGEDATKDEKMYPAFLKDYIAGEADELGRDLSNSVDGLRHDAREHHSDVTASGTSSERCEGEARCDENRLAEDPFVEEPHQQSSICESGWRDSELPELSNDTTVVASTGERFYKCVACNKVFTRKASLVVHERVHTGSRPYRCVICNQTFNRKSNLICHERTHMGERPYKCGTCDRTFIRKEYLVVHERKHTGERPYQCCTCGRTFVDKQHLVRHEREHRRERPYKCITCDKTFTRKFSLVVHERKHTGERPYRCVTCDKTFNHKSSLVVHERNHK